MQNSILRIKSILNSDRFPSTTTITQSTTLLVLLPRQSLPNNSLNLHINQFIFPLTITSLLLHTPGLGSRRLNMLLNPVYRGNNLRHYFPTSASCGREIVRVCVGEGLLVF